MNNLIYEYEGHGITFQKGDSVMVNATEMAKSFGKQPKDWLKGKQSEEYLDALLKGRNIRLTDFVRVTKGGRNPGTWFHKDIALEFARWLSPAFSIWCNDRIMELMEHGFTATPSTLEEMLANPDLVIGLATQLKKERDENKLLEARNRDMAPKAMFMDRVMDTEKYLDMGQTAKVLGLPYGRNTLFKKLRDKGVLFKDKNEPKQTYIDRKYFLLKERLLTVGGKDVAVVKVLVTQKGLKWLAGELWAELGSVAMSGAALLEIDTH